MVTGELLRWEGLADLATGILAENVTALARFPLACSGK
jgi:hypothetical protein